MLTRSHRPRGHTPVVAEVREVAEVTSLTGAERAAPAPSAAGRPKRSPRPGARRVLTYGGAVILPFAVWEMLKVAVPADGVRVAGTQILPRTDAGALPSPLSVLETLFKPNVDVPGVPSTGDVVLHAMLRTLDLAVQGFALGVAVGAGLALLMFFVRTAEHALLPYVVVGPTVPILAITPLVAAWGGRFSLLGHRWEAWMSVVLITAYLTVLPVAAGLLRGLQSAHRRSLDLIHCLAATRRQGFVHLYLPSAVPYLIPSLKLAAAGATVSTIVSEISTGASGGIGRLIMDYIPGSSSDASRLYAAVLAAALLGILATAAVSLASVPLRKYQVAR